jgi:hypothetical protein
MAKTHEDKLAYLEGRLRTMMPRWRSARNSFRFNVEGQQDVTPTSPWNAWDIAMFVACALGIVCLIGFGMWNISFNLLESGLVTFRENPFRSYLWAALLPSERCR